jgi:hypothetical protein
VELKTSRLEWAKRTEEVMAERDALQAKLKAAHALIEKWRGSRMRYETAQGEIWDNATTTCADELSRALDEEVVDRE